MRAPAQLPRTPSPPHISADRGSDENAHFGGVRGMSDGNDDDYYPVPNTATGSIRKRRTPRQSQPSNKKAKLSPSISSFKEHERDILDDARDQLWLYLCLYDTMLEGIPLLRKSREILQASAQKFNVAGQCPIIVPQIKIKTDYLMI